LSGSLRLWEDQAEAKGLTFRRELDECPGPIVGDAARIRQIVFNLMSNALKFTSTGSVSLRVASDGDDRLRIVVADTGVGIPADKREEIFESFRQADTSTTRQFGGTGLGLAICRNLAHAMGGDVRVESEAGAGARFIVDLPLVAAVALDDGHGCRPVSDLLVIDRNPISRAMLKTLMMPHMGEIATAASLDEGVSFLQRERVERILVDATTLTIGGDTLAATERLIASVPCARITMLWPATLAAERSRIIHFGQIVHVIKPVTGAALADAIVASGDVALVSQAA
jgi:anti-sigma regulatory factor (Ser/Thr protein kinase)/CheY-like chemotaxis protein